MPPPYTEGKDLPPTLLHHRSSVCWLTLCFSARPLLYGLEMEENYKVLRSYAFQSKDYQVTPGSPWNFAIQLRDDSAPEKDMEFVTTGWTAGEHPFSPRGAPGRSWPW